jgi:hypothetical protein
MPLPVNVAGSWSWIAQTGLNLPEKITASTHQAELPDTAVRAREGHLKLSAAVGTPGQST